MHGQNAGDSSFSLWVQPSKCLNFQAFFVNSTVKSKARLSFWPVAHRNRRIWLVAILSWVFFGGNRGSSARPGLESVAASTSKTEICKKTRKITEIIHDGILYCNFRWNDYEIKFAQNKAAVCNLKSRMVYHNICNLFLRRQYYI